MAFQAKSAELKADTARVAEELDGLGDVDPLRGKAALAVFDWSQRAAETWLGSNNADRRQILDAVCLNRQVTDVTLCTTRRKPFDLLAERLDLKNCRGDCQSVEPRERLVDPYVAAVIETPDVYLDTVAELARECA